MVMGVSIAGQTLLFLRSMLLGACLMLFYDCFRILRIAVPMPDALVLAQDVLFFAVCAVTTFLFLVSANYGEVRFFALLGEGLGALLCAMTASRLLMACSKAIIAFVRRVLRLFFVIFLRPVYLVIRWVAGGFIKMVDYCGIWTKKSLHKANYGLKRRRLMLYNLVVHREPGKGSRPKRRKKAVEMEKTEV